MRLLDLFCGAGGCAVGYHRAGFTEIVGVDVKPQPRYPFPFVQMDALECLRWLQSSVCYIESDSDDRAYFMNSFDAIHASPPCQRYSSASRVPTDHPDLYEPTVRLLAETGKPYAVENVIGAPLHYGIVLCGSMFGLEHEGEWLRRHRTFETSMFLFQQPCRHPKKRPVTITGKAYGSETREYDHSRQTTFENCKRLMGIDWMSRDEMAQAIPPAYTEFIGRQLLDAINAKESPCDRSASTSSAARAARCS